MNTVTIGLFTRSLRAPLRKAIAIAAELGAEGVVIDARNELRIAEFSQTSFRQFRKLLEDHGLRVAAVSFPTRRGLDDPEDLERRVLALRDAMAFAYQIGARVLLCNQDTLPDAEAESSSWSTLIDSLRLLSDHGDRVGVRAAVGSAEAPDRQAELFTHLPEGTIGADLDPAALVAAGHDPEEAATLLGPHLLHLRAHDAVREAGARRATETQLGRGMVDVPTLLARVEEHAYRGWVSVERNEAVDAREDLANAIAYLRSL